MPPLRGIDRGINGEMLKALEEIGHGAQIAVVDASYDIPKGAQVVDYQGGSTAQAIRGILDLVPTDDDYLIAMVNDEYEHGDALLETIEAIRPRPIVFVQPVTRLGDEAGENPKAVAGFYALANDPEKHTLFVRTRDVLAYACAMFVVGHSQE